MSTTVRTSTKPPVDESDSHPRTPRDLSPEKRRDLSPDKRARDQTTVTDEEVSKLLKRVPRSTSPEKRAKEKQLTLVTDAEVTSIFKTLITYTLLIIFVPIATYFGAKKYVFEDMLGYDSRQAFIMWAVLSVASIHVVLGIMVYRAYQDGIKPRNVKMD